MEVYDVSKFYKFTTVETLNRCETQITKNYQTYGLFLP